MAAGRHPEPRVPGATEVRFVPGPLATTMIATLPLLVFLVVIPVQIYAGNQPYFDYRYELVLHLGAVYLAGAVASFCLFRAVPGSRRVLGYPLAALGVAMFVVYFIDPPSFLALEGGLPEFEVPVPAAIAEVAAVAALLIVAWRTPERVVVDWLAWFCALVLAAMPVLLAVEVLRVPPAVRNWAARSAPPVPAADSFNIYHVVLDAYDGTSFERVVEALGMRERFGGFTWYPNAYANYTLTLLSFPSFMTGTMREGPASERPFIERGRSAGMLAALADRGYFVSQYNAFPVNDHERARQRVTAREIEQPLFGNLRAMSQLLDLTVLLAAPALLRPDVADNGRGPFARWLYEHGREIADWTRDGPLLSVLLFRRLVEDEAERPLRGQYVGAHLLIPHRPYTMSSDCEYEPWRRAAVATRLDQAACAIRLVEGLLRAIERKGNYAESLILVHSDHGDTRRERPLLLVKPPGRGVERPLAADDTAVQLLDIVPTVYDLLGIEHAALAGVPLHSPAARAPREIRVFSPLKHGR